MKTHKTIARAIASAVAASALAWLAISAGTTSVPTGDIATKAVADEGPGYAIEDFGYPYAAKILAERNIKLKRGDGHILLADCASATDLLEIFSRDKEKICFRVNGNRGWLTMEIPSVFAVKGNAYAAHVDMSVGTEQKTYEIDKNAWTPVGESADEQGREFMLLEIRTTK